MQKLMNAGARPQRLLWASTGTKDETASPTMYLDGLVAPYTVNTTPDGTLRACSAQGAEPPPLMATDGVEAERVLAQFAAAGVDVDVYAAELQQAGAEAFVDSWTSLLGTIAERRAAVGAGR
jgi:transaldolase